MYILGIGGLLGHDSNIALFKDNELLFSAQEERFTIKKHDASFPINSINHCLKNFNITYNDIDVCIFAEKPFYLNAFNNSGKQPNFLVNAIGRISNFFEENIFEKEAKKLFQNAKFHYSWHHTSHVTAGFHSSGFDESVFLCVDGKSENSNASVGFINDDKFVLEKELEYDNGIGMFYTLITHFLGFPSFGSEYKVMGLAPYGEAIYVNELYKLANTDENGSFRLKFNPSFNPNNTKDFFYLVENATGIKRAENKQELNSQQVDLATSLQKVFETEVLKMAGYAKKLFPQSKNLVFCGGCAQNCVAAGVLRDANIFENVFNSPIGGDMGSAIGACLNFIRSTNLDIPSFFKSNFYFGSKPGVVTNPESAQYEIPLVQNIYTTTAQLLADGNICGWIQDGMELGARALGARSILANPLDPEMQTKMNLKIKFRESFRPFAPIILEEEQSNWFDTEIPSYYMQYTAYLKKELRYSVPKEFKDFKERLNFPRCKVPSIVHVDFSARLQTISKEVHPAFYKLLQEFYRITKVPILINTSFNVNGQPIVRTANEAWECFIHTDIDYLIVENKIYRHPKNLTQEEKIKWLNQFENYSK